MKYVSTWGVYRYFDNKDMVNQEDWEIFCSLGPGAKVFECVSEEKDVLGLKYGNKIFQAYSRSYKVVPEPLYKLGEHVYIPRKEKKGIIINIEWHSKNKAHMYFLEIDGKKYSRRYYENELRKL